MTGISKHISSFFIVILCTFGITSCIYDNDADCNGPTEGNGGTQGTDQLLLVLHISPLDAGSSSSVDVQEKIKSLRIIILDDDTIECNKLVEFDAAPTASSSFNYIYTWSTNPGEKGIYLIANEESVTNIQSTETLSPNNTTLNTLLESYQAGTKSGDFETIINSIYFEPEYEKDETGSIFLPYTSYYKIKAQEKEQEIRSMYLVPVATKFTFNFINKRSSAVSIKKISVSPIDNQNYLFAKVGDSDQKKDFGEEKELYWIDWLAKVSEELHKHYSDNVSFNEIYGWISDYQLPNTSNSTEKILISEDNQQSVLGIGAEKEDAKTLTLGPFYLPESRGESYSYTEKDENQNDVTIVGYNYYLTLNLEDKTNHSTPKPEFTNQKIENLKSLFRNTSVIINVTMSEGDIEIYAEIAEWNVKTANGWVVEGQQPPNLSSIAHKQ